MTMYIGRFNTVLTAGPKGAALLPVPLEPAAVWGSRPAYHLAGTINGMGYRGVLETAEGGWVLKLGPAWRRDCGLAAGDAVEVALVLEGPQRFLLTDDLKTALEAEPEAAAFFDGLPQFYRKAYLRWIAATKKSPEKRAERIAATVGYLKDRLKERPR